MRLMCDLTLLSWLYRRTLIVTLPGAAIAAALVLLPKQPLSRVGELWAGTIGLFIVFHAIALVVVQAQPFSGSTGFLYMRGFSRDRLWCHQVLASIASGLTVCLAMGLVTWTPLRAWWHDVMMQSPYYLPEAPGYGAARFDHQFILFPLAIYVFMIPMLHYAWIRRAVPMRGQLVGPLLIGWFIAASLFVSLLASVTSDDQMPTVYALITLVAVIGLLLAWSWRLHRRMEVGS